MQGKILFSLLCAVGLVGCNSGIIANTSGPFLAEPLTRHPTGLPLTLLSRYYAINEMKDDTGTIFLNPGSSSLPLGRDPASVALADDGGISIVTLAGVVLHRERWNEDSCEVGTSSGTMVP